MNNDDTQVQPKYDYQAMRELTGANRRRPIVSPAARALAAACLTMFLFFLLLLVLVLGAKITVWAVQL